MAHVADEKYSNVCQTCLKTEEKREIDLDFRKYGPKWLKGVKR